MFDLLLADVLDKSRSLRIMRIRIGSARLFHISNESKDRGKDQYNDAADDQRDRIVVSAAPGSAVIAPAGAGAYAAVIVSSGTGRFSHLYHAS